MDPDSKYLFDFPLELETLKSKNQFIAFYKHSMCTADPKLYENREEIKKIELMARDLYGLTASVISLALSELLDMLRQNVYEDNFDLSDYISKACEDAVANSDDIFPDKIR